MGSESDFHTFARELFQPLGPVLVRRMFGGAGLFLDGVMFALIAEDTLYMKVDAINQGEFEAAGTEPFRSETGRGVHEFSYYELPADCLDDQDAALAWGQSALAAARRARQAKPPSRRKAGTRTVRRGKT
ncbi:MAG: TfoX family protein [Alphaproteobacteria bacterium]|nr:TfoX family protein [Alphaproteobacteria bacterium]